MVITMATITVEAIIMDGGEADITDGSTKGRQWCWGIDHQGWKSRAKAPTGVGAKKTTRVQ